MSKFTRHLQGDQVVGDVKAIAAGAATLSLNIISEAPGCGNHCSYAVEFYSDAAGTTVVAASAGTAAFTFTEVVLPSEVRIPDAQGALPANGIFPNLSNDNHPVDFAAPGHIATVKIVLANIAGDPTHARIRFAGSPA